MSVSPEENKEVQGTASRYGTKKDLRRWKQEHGLQGSGWSWSWLRYVGVGRLQVELLVDERVLLIQKRDMVQHVSYEHLLATEHCRIAVDLADLDAR